MTRLDRSMLAALALVMVAASGAEAQRRPRNQRDQRPPGGALWVKVFGPDSLPLPGAQVVLPMLGFALPVPEGGALLVTSVPAGTHVLEVRRAGFATATSTVQVGADTVLARVSMAPLEGEAGRVVDATPRFFGDTAARQLDPVTVVADASSASAYAARLSDFERRRQAAAFGRFVTRDDIAQWGSHDMASVLRHVQGIEVETGRGGVTVKNRRSAGTTCAGMLVFLDGVLVSGQQMQAALRLAGEAATRGPFTANRPADGPPGGTTNPTPSTQAPRTGTASGRAGSAFDGAVNRDMGQMASGANDGVVPTFDLNSVSVRSVAGVEVYPAGGSIPAEYAGHAGATECGVMLVWTTG